MIYNILHSPIMLGLILILGLVLLVRGADQLVAGASYLARRIGISDLVIGLTIVAFGTSAPEFVVNMVSVANHATDLAITNILGSNIINTLVILGCSALVFPIVAPSNSIKFDIPMNILAGVLVLLFVSVGSIDSGSGLSHFAGIVLLAVFLLFIVYTFRTARQSESAEAATTDITISVWWCLLMIVVGLVCLVSGGEMIVRSATTIARRLDVPESVIGLTIVALGTSLPELATSVVAAVHHNSDIAIGNVVGSNIFNVFFILGTSAAISPLAAYKGIGLDTLVTALSATIVLVLVCSNKEHAIKRWGGAVLLLVYAAYLAYRLMNY